MFGDNLQQQKLFMCWMYFSKVPSKVLSCPLRLVSYDKLTMFFPAVPARADLALLGVRAELHTHTVCVCSMPRNAPRGNMRPIQICFFCHSATTLQYVVFTRSIENKEILLLITQPQGREKCWTILKEISQ